MTFYILIPLYNEAPNIAALATTLLKALPGKPKHYVLVDDHSTDDTVARLHKSFAGAPYTLLEKEKNHGPGHSFNLGFEWILAHAGSEHDKVITLEADNTSDPAILPHMAAISEMGYSLVLASIYAQSGGFHQTGFFRKLISFVANMFFRSFFNIKVLTLSSFYRVYHVELLRAIQNQHKTLIREPGFICMLEILLKAIKEGASVIEVPMTLRSGNRIGKSKMKIMKTTLSYIRFFLRSHKPG